MSDIFDFDIANLVGAGDGANSNPCIKFQDLIPKPNLQIMSNQFYVADVPFSSYGGGISGSGILKRGGANDTTYNIVSGFYAPVDGTIYRLDLPCRYDFTKPNIQHTNPTPSFRKDAYFETENKVTGVVENHRNNTNYNTWMQFYDLSHLSQVSFKIPHILFVSKEKKYGKTGNKYLVYVVGGSRLSKYYETGKEFKQGQFILPQGSMFSVVGNMVDSYYRFMSISGSIITDADLSETSMTKTNITPSNISTFTNPQFSEDVFLSELLYGDELVFPMVQVMSAGVGGSTDVFGNIVEPFSYYLGLSTTGPIDGEGSSAIDYVPGLERNPTFSTIGLSNSEFADKMSTSYTSSAPGNTYNAYVLNTVLGSYHHPEFGLTVAAMEFDTEITSADMFLSYQDLDSVMGGNDVDAFSPTKLYEVSFTGPQPDLSGGSNVLVVNNSLIGEYKMDWGTSKRFAFKSDSVGDLSNIPQTTTITGGEDYCSGYLNPATRRHADGYLFNYMHMPIYFLVGQSMNKVFSTLNSITKLQSDLLNDGTTHYGYSGRSSNVSRGYSNDGNLTISKPSSTGSGGSSNQRYIKPQRKTTSRIVIPRHDLFDGFHGDNAVSASPIFEYQDAGITLDMAVLDRFNLSESNNITKKVRKQINVDEIYSDPMGFIGAELLDT